MGPPKNQKSNAHAHVCAFALDGVKNVTNGRTKGQGVSRSRKVKTSENFLNTNGALERKSIDKDPWGEW